jgi:hypothetical protein
MANYIVNGTADAPRKKMPRAFIDLHSYGQLCEFRNLREVLRRSVADDECARWREGSALRFVSRRDKPHRATG